MGPGSTLVRPGSGEHRSPYKILHLWILSKQTAKVGPVNGSLTLGMLVEMLVERVFLVSGVVCERERESEDLKV